MNFPHMGRRDGWNTKDGGIQTRTTGLVPARKEVLCEESVFLCKDMVIQMKKAIATIALSGAIMLTAILCGCNTNPQDTTSNGSSNAGSSNSSTSSHSSGTGSSSSNHSSTSSPSTSSDADDLVSPV